MSEEQKVRVKDLKPNGQWNGYTVEVMVDDEGGEHDVLFISQFRELKWPHTYDCCHDCGRRFKPYDQMIVTEVFFVYPCKSCEHFIWYHVHTGGEHDAFQ